MNREEQSTLVPNKDKQVEEDLWQRYGAERGVWSKAMLIALEKGIEGNKWFSLIDKVRSDRTLGIAWEKVRSNAGACGVDGISVAFFEKDSQNRLLAVKERLTEYLRTQADPTGPHTEARKQREAPIRHPRSHRPRGAKCGEDGYRTYLRTRLRAH